MSDENYDGQFDEKHPPMERWGSRTFLFLFHDVWFRVFVIAALLAVVFLSLFLPKIWVRTPPEFQPPLKASGMNLVQAWRLKRVAAQQHAAGDINRAIDAWTVAELNDPGDASIPRGALETLLLATKSDREQLFYGYERAIHLLRLTRTNSADLELVARFFFARNLHQYLSGFIPPGLTNLGPRTAAALLATAFDRKDMKAFEQLWNQHQATLATDVPSQLRHAAWAVEWGPAGGAGVARQALQTALGQPENHDLANQLLLTVHLQREDLSAYRKTMQDLIERHADRPRDHIGLWRLIYRSGAKTEAIALARRHTAPAANPSEASDYATALNQLGLADVSADYLNRELPNFGFEVNLWRVQAKNFIQLKQWDELRHLAVLMRNSIPLHGQLEGFSGFCEAYADAATDRPESAAPLFIKAAGESFGTPDLAFECVLAMRSLGYPVPALQLCGTLTNRVGNDVDFWFQYTLTAAAAKDPAVTLLAAEKAYTMAPQNSAYGHNYATALLVNRRLPAKALELSVARLREEPHSYSAIINHALALLLNGYTSEVEKLLNPLGTRELSPDETADLQLAWFEYYVTTKQYPLARVAYGRIETRRLFPSQVDWIREALAKFPSGA